MKLTVILDVLGLIFLVLKLTNVIDWAWIQVCIPFIVHGAIIAVSVIVQIIAALIESR